MRITLSSLCVVFTVGCTQVPATRPPVLDASWRADEKDRIVQPRNEISPSSKEVHSKIGELTKDNPVKTVLKLKPIDQPKGQVDIPSPVLSLLKQADQLRGASDLMGASSRLERAQRLMPNEPEIYFQLSSLRLEQGKLKDAVDIATQGISYAGSDGAIKRDLYLIISRARDALGDSNGSTKARQLARAAGS